MHCIHEQHLEQFWILVIQKYSFYFSFNKLPNLNSSVIVLLYWIKIIFISHAMKTQRCQTSNQNTLNVTLRWMKLVFRVRSNNLVKWIWIIFQLFSVQILLNFKIDSIISNEIFIFILLSNLHRETKMF